MSSSQNAPAPKTSGKAIASLVFGILSLPPCLIWFCIWPAVLGLLLGILGVRDVGRSNGQLKGKGLAIAGIVTSTIGLIFAVIVFINLYSKAIADRDRQRSMQNFKQIGIAYKNYASAFNDQCPSAISTSSGQPLLSWRVSLLPHMDEDRRYGQFVTTEAWDSPRNRPLLNPIPQAFKDPFIEMAADATPYRMFVGPNTLYPDPGKRSPFAFHSIPDGSSNTIMAVQASDGVPWSKPEELTFVPGQTLSKLGPPGFRFPEGYFFAVLMDGSVRTVSRTISEETLRRAIDPADGQTLGSDW